MKEEKPSVEEIDERTDAEKALDLYRKGDKWKMVDAKVRRPQPEFRVSASNAVLYVSDR